MMNTLIVCANAQRTTDPVAIPIAMISTDLYYFYPYLRPRILLSQLKMYPLTRPPKKNNDWAVVTRYS